MNCSVHHEKEAKFRCFQCGEFICKECAVDKDGKVVCKKCSENYVSESRNNPMNMRKSNSFWAFIFSLIPGAGQMYLGLMKRGLQIMLIFSIPIILSSMLYSVDAIFVLFNLIIWFYSFFDCQHIKKAISQGEEIEDKLIYDVNISDMTKNLNYKHVGIGFIVIGGLALLNNGFYRLTDYINTNYSHDVYQVFRFIRQSSFPVLLIIVGVFLLKKSRVQKEA